MIFGISGQKRGRLLFFLSFLFWAIVFSSIWPKMLVMENGELWAGWVNVWGDWAAHISFATSMATQNNFPPQFPIYSGHVLSYPFAVDFVSSLLLRAGLTLVPAMLIPSIILSLVTVGLLLVFYYKILQDEKRAVISTFLFLLNGGLGFWLFFENAARSNGDFFQALVSQEYTHLEKPVNLVWINIITSELIPQRGFLLGLPISLLVIIFFWRVFQRGKNLKPKLFLFSGIAVGLLPVIHMHSLLVLFLSAFWVFVLTAPAHPKTTKYWILYFFAPAISSSLLMFALFYPHLKTTFIKFYPGWLASGSFLTFWLLNAGLTGVLSLVGLFMAWKTKLFWFSLPFMGLFILANLFIFQPWPWDNTKLFSYWWLFAAAFASLPIAYLLSGNFLAKLAGLLLFVASVASGSLDVARLTQHEQLKIRMADKNALQLASWVANNTPKDAVFLTADNHDHPVTMLSGRSVVLGFPGWLWTYGIDASERKRDVEDIYLAKSPVELLDKYQVSYVVIGEAEKILYKLDEKFFEQNFPTVYSNSTVKVYKTP